MSESDDKFMSFKTPAIYYRERVFFTDLVTMADRTVDVDHQID